MIGIYKIENLINGKVYIGQSSDIERRWKDHKSDYRVKDSLIYRAIRKYGIENFEFKIIEECKEEDLDNLEIYYIWYYNSYVGNQNHNGYNSTTGGKGTGRGGGSPHSKKVICDGIIYSCAREFADVFNLNYTKVKNWLSHRNLTPVEWYVLGLRYLDDSSNTYEFREKQYNPKARKVVCDNKEFDSLTEFCNHFKLKQYTVGCWLRHENNMPIEWYILGLRYIDEPMNSYTYRREKRIICNNTMFYSIKEVSEYLKENYNTCKTWINGRTKIPEKYKHMNIHIIE